MSDAARQLKSATSSVRASLPMTSDGIETAGRIGYVTRGIIYGLVGILATQAAVNGRSSSPDTQGVIAEIGSQPLGQFLLWSVAIGLTGFALFRFIVALRDPEKGGGRTQSRLRRASYAISGVVHASLAFFTVRLAMGFGGGGSSEQQQSASVLSMPGGPLILGLIGAILLVVAIIHFKKAYKKDFMRHYKASRLNTHKLKWLERIGQFGLAARGLTFAIIGWFVIQASIDYNPREVIGLRGAFNELASQPFGSALLIIVALGFVAFGIYSATRGIYGTLRT